MVHVGFDDAALVDDAAVVAAVCEAYTGAAPLFEMYANLVADQEAALERLAQVRATNDEFVDFLEDESFILNDIDIADHLVTPHQRVAKYPLLFRQLLRATPDGHPARDAVVRAEGCALSIVAMVNRGGRGSAGAAADGHHQGLPSVSTAVVMLFAAVAMLFADREALVGAL